ncbi:MAG: radical SAM protein [Candidatus Rokubacteria bacterium]|nr:radical SAM protein [Candidatus Rokubacteria bacterium]MBI3107072.1 radical SAM protein [Candidatus Rokubacteria bacterium]
MAAVWPAYLALSPAELRKRAARAVKALAACTACPRDCKVDRLAERTAVCKTGRYARVASHFPHRGEEDCLRGWRGSGTIFFSWCNLRCAFCQNFDVSQEGAGREVSPGELAGMMLELQGLGCHNINLVTPEHVVPQILEALPTAIERGLRLPLVYNTSAYDGMHSLRLMDGIVDIYMPDFKCWDPEASFRYLRAREYPEVARAAIREMHRQVGDLVLDERGLARRGLLVRHLVMPGDLAGTPEIASFLAEEISPHTYVNVMDQYRPAGRAIGEDFEEIARPVSHGEYAEAVRAMLEAGLHRLDHGRGLASAGV